MNRSVESSPFHHSENPIPTDQDTEEFVPPVITHKRLHTLPLREREEGTWNWLFPHGRTIGSVAIDRYAVDGRVYTGFIHEAVERRFDIPVALARSPGVTTNIKPGNVYWNDAREAAKIGYTVLSLSHYEGKGATPSMKTLGGDMAAITKHVAENALGSLDPEEQQALDPSRAIYDGYSMGAQVSANAGVEAPVHGVTPEALILNRMGLLKKLHARDAKHLHMLRHEGAGVVRQFREDPTGTIDGLRMFDLRRKALPRHVADLFRVAWSSGADALLRLDPQTRGLLTIDKRDIVSQSGWEEITEHLPHMTVVTPDQGHLGYNSHEDRERGAHYLADFALSIVGSREHIARAA